MTDGAEKTVYSACTLCYHSCGTEVTVKGGKVTEVKGQQSHPLNKGKLCPKGRATLEHLYHPDRLTHPLKKVEGGWEKISWEQAFSEIGTKLNGLKEQYGPETLAFFCGSIGVENLEIVSLTHRFQGAFGTPNFFSVESICFRMRVRTRQMTFGKYVVEELDSPLYILWGHNPAASDFPLAMAIAENMKKGSKVVVIDPRRIAIADKAEMYLAIRPGTDGAMALAMINVMINEKLYDAEFVEKWTYGFDKLVPHVQQYTPEWAEQITSVKADDIRKLARLFAGTKGAGIYHGTCTQDQCANGSQTDRAFAILQTLTGNINVPGGWVAGPRLRLADITLPIPGVPLGADEYPLFHQFWGRTSPYGVMNMVPESIPDKIKAFIVAGGNPLVTMPDSNALQEAFDRLDLLVVYDQFMSETARHAHYVLPSAHHLEGWGLGYNYNVCHNLPYLMLREPAVEPLGESKTTLEFYAGLAEACGFGELFPWKSDKELIADEVAPSGLDFHTLLASKGGALFGEKTYGLQGRPFPTPSGKIEIYSHAFEEAGFDPLPTYLEPFKSPQGPRWEELGERYPLVLATGTRTLYYNGTQLHNIQSLQKFEPFPRAEIGPQTAAAFGIAHKDDVIVETDRGWVRMKADVNERTMEGVVLVPHGWEGEANCNRLTDAQCREPIMGYPQWKGLLCAIRKAE
ncbi:molybdopterin-dependent oxidoreductase [Geobacter hydrogenophilus]|uniref:Dehydrogenase n=1 Tax=Geobacter hydrogenophilus TaxID=40983 RepID=A0A9W6LED6_9BACT|nr:molybdopterin-dependent oxidoreductase [Geobacter hydrogenophilus]MBT0894438.1 molybdopterin-dependent oxidoreductase [Geobacter hydrogenophilus]GLI39406.1 dehydrogenase [Geobacter hydrogenophilus]